MNVREAILKALGQFPIHVTAAVVTEVEGRVSRKNPRNPVGFAYVAARNWAIDQVRKQAVAAKQNAALMLAEERQKATRAEFERMKREFDDFVFQFLPRLRPAQQKHLEIVGKICFDGLRDVDCARLYPDTTANQRYQWKCRGLKMLKQYASPDFTNFLKKRSEHVPDIGQG